MFCSFHALRLALSAVAIASLTFVPQLVVAAEGDDADAATIERYTGPPILLDEGEAPPPAALVEKRVNKDEFSEGKVRYEREIARYSDDRFVADGFYREYYPTGEKFVEGQYKDGHQDGTWTYYHKNGQVQRTVTFKNGLPDGSTEVHNTEGAVVAKRQYKSGKRDGTWEIFDETGKQQLRQESYADGLADGVWKIWFPSGQLRTEISMKKGTRDGRSREWDEEGNPRAEVNFVAGKADGVATLWDANGKKVIREFEDGKLIKEDRE